MCGSVLPQRLVCCRFRNGVKHALVVMSAYLSYCCLFIILNLSAHSSLTSDINKAFVSTLLPQQTFSLSWPFPVNLRDGCVENFKKLDLLFDFNGYILYQYNNPFQQTHNALELWLPCDMHTETVMWSIGYT